MKTIFLILFILLLVILFPIPLKTIIYYSKENYYIKLFNFYILRKKFNIKTKESSESIAPNKNSEKKHNKKTLFKNLPLIKIIKKLNNNRFKPILLINGYLHYSLEDSAYTAISFGFLNSILVLINKLINIPFKSKNFNINIIPDFKDKLFYEIKVKCILIFNIGQIIYILLEIIKIIINRKVREYE